MRVEGECHCGAITYEADVEPGMIGICHCFDCQTLTGSAFRANILARSDCFRIVTGEPRRYIKIADSGAKRVHAFCEICGSPVYSCAIDNPSTYSLRVGALKQRYELGRPGDKSGQNAGCLGYQHSKACRSLKDNPRLPLSANSRGWVCRRSYLHVSRHDAEFGSCGQERADSDAAKCATSSLSDCFG